MSTSVAALQESRHALKTGKPGEQDERDLILAARNGDRSAFGELVMKYRSQFVRIAAAMTGDLETARDLTQESFIKAYRALDRFDPGSPFSPWFYQILRNTCRDHIRSKGRFREMLERFTSQASRSADLEDEVEKADLIQKIREAVKKLDSRDREIIEMKHFAGFDYGEIAEILNIPRGTVMSRLFYARKALKERLEKEFDFFQGGVS